MSATHYRRFQLSIPVSFLSFSLMIASTGCQSIPASSAGTTKTLTALSVSPSSTSIGVGATQQFTATATYSDSSTANVTSTANWMAATPAVATVNSGGMATAVASGSTAITASLNGVSGNSMLNVTAVPKTVTSVAVSPASVSVSVGATQQFTATATYSDSSTGNVSSTASWTTANTAVATVNSTGLATAVAVGSTALTASLSGVSGSATLSVVAITPTVTAISVAPTTPSVVVGATEQFSATAIYSDGSTTNITTSATWTTATAAVATINSAGLATAAAPGLATVTASLSAVSGGTTLNVTLPAGIGTNVPTWHFDAQRSGLNAAEASLTTTNVNPQNFGKLFTYLLDGYAYGQPLLVSNVTISGGTHNVVYAATENDSVYAFDADNYGTGAPLWQVSLLNAGETPITNGPILPVEGITSTPAIDLTTNTMFVVSTESAASGTSFRLNALDITTGAHRSGSPVTIQASMAGVNAGTLTTVCLQRAALLVVNGSVFIGFASCHSGWLLAYDEQTLAQTGAFNASPNLVGEGSYASAGGIWMGGGGPAADDLGNIYVTTGNGPWDGQTAWSDSVLKFNAKLTIEDYFTPNDYAYMDCADSDLAAGGLLLIPGTTEALAGGKTGKLYLVNTTDLGHESATDAGATQTSWFEDDLIQPYPASCTDPEGNTWTTDINSYEIFGTAAYFNGSVYLGVTPTTATAPAGVRQFTYSGKLTQGNYTTPSIMENSRGTTPFISANGTANGILWMIDHGQPLQSADTQTTATLRAYDANNLTDELYNSGANSADVPGYGIKFTSPIVANGKVYITTGHDPVTATNPQGELDVYGLK